MPGQPVAFETDSIGNFTAPCPGEPQQDRTDSQGDFRFCFAQGPLNASAHVGVVVDGIRVTKPMDTSFRRSVVIVRDPNGTGVAPPAWNETFRIAGRALHPREQVVDGVQLYDEPVPDVPVNLTLETASGNGSLLQVSTDALGDFDAMVRLVNGTLPQDVRLRVEALGQSRPAALDAVSHRSTVGLELRLPGDGAPVQASFPPEPPAPPGSGSAGATPLLVAGIALALVATLVWARRKR
jgi:hypothetical protein